jgi:myxalamid-type polyketide synthase MxaE and MxaD
MESEALATTTLVGGDHEIEPEPIAIIGMSCRFPGARDPKAFWQLLRNGVDAITQVPAERQELCAFYDRNTMIPDEMPPRWGGFLEQIDQFDPRFFSISPREAARIDPQQRLLLEVSWEALEDAGQAMERLGGTRTGVFVGISSNDYGQLLLLDPGFSDPYAGTGNALSIAANRLSYVFDFRGPSMAIDTACSSSLVAVHLACQSLRRGECALALAGGVNLVLSPVITANFTKAGFMAPDGRCKAFDARANGYVRGEGVGVVILKPLSKALADGDLIYAVIRGSAVNNDGRTNGLTAPSRQAQEAVLREACQRAKILPGQIQYIEAHGTGTALGDPIEAEALGAVLAIDRSPKNFCAVGSVKTNIGHLEAAAGIAGLIKTALALKHREIPPNLHFQEPNLYIPFDKLRLRVQQRLSPWPEGPGPALAGVSSFGFGGANAHVILEEAPGKWQGANGNEQEARDEKQILQITEQVAGEHSRFATSHLPLATCHLLPLSAHSPEALQSLARAYLDFLAAEPPESATLLPDICYSAGVRRSHHDHRLTVVAHTKAEVVESLQAFLQGESRPGVATGCNHPNQRSQLVFVFCGQGPQWWAMGRELLMQEPVFHSALEDCDRLLGQCAAWSLLEEFHADESHSRLNETEIAQPALFALQIALAALWRYWGVVPDVVVGHSVGEVAAAHLAGALSLEDAVRVVFHRGRLMQRATGQGKMATVELSPEEAKQAIAAYENRLSIAAINSPTSTVLSGDPHALAAVLESLRKQEILCRELPVDYAFHSAQMEPFQSDLEQALQGLEAHPVSAPIFSTVTGQAGNGRDFDAAYWQRQIRQPVRFAAAIDSLVEEGRRLFLEIGPHPVLAVAITQCLRHRGQEGAALPSLRRGEEERAVMLGSLGALYAQGCPLDWRRLYPAGGRYVQLPFYPWQRERCWIETEEADPWLNRWRAGGDQSDVRRHPLLGRPVKLAHLSEGYFWENQLNRRLLPYLADHRFQGAVLLPGTAYLEMAIAAAVEAFGAGSHTLTGVELRSPLFLSENSSYTVQLILSPDTGGEVSFRIFSRPGGEEQADGSWTLHALGKINRDANDSDSRLMEPTGPKQLQERCPEEISGEHCYLELREKGLEYGPRFQGLKQLWRCKGEALGLVQLPQVLESELEAYHLHPALLDACAQVLVAADSNNDRLLVPVGVNKVRFYKRPGARLWSHAQLEPEGEQPENEIVGDIRLLDEAGDVVAEALGLRLQSLDGNIQRVAPANPDDWIYLLQWQPEPHPEAGRASQPTVPSSSGTWLIFADKEGVGEALAALLAEAGERHVLVSPGSTYERVDGGHFRICPARLEYIRQLFNDVFGDGQPPCRGVVHLWGLDTLPLEEITAASLEAEQRPGCGTVVSLVQEMVRTEWSEPPRLWLVTRGTQAVEGSPNPPTVSQATLWGLGRTIAQEQPAIWGGLIDLEPGALVDHDGSLLWQEVSNPDGENQLAFRQGERYVARLVRKPKFKDRDAALQWRPDGSYLITGGLGGLGFLVARWMVEQGARRLILLGRTQLPPRAEWDQVEKGSRLAGQIAAIRKLEFLGASVHIASVDVSDEAQLAAFLDTFRREGWPPIRGVVHAAGVLQDQILLRLDPTAMAAVFRAKVIGGWLLHRLFEDTPLDFFVLFSSAASLLGSPGQGNYAAANAFLDALAHHRHAQGKSALSINWGPWAEAGMAAQPNRGERLARQGIGSIQPEQGLELLGRLLRQDAIQVGVIPINWTQLFRSFSELRELPLLTQLAKESAAASPETDSARENEGLARKAILAAEPDQRQKLLESALCEQVARVVGLSASKLDVRQPLNTLGIDSLMGVELKIRVETELGVVVPAVKLLEGPSIAELATLLLRQISATPTAPQESAVEHAASSRRPQIVEIQPAGSKPPFFCVHPGALDVRCYSDLARYLGDEQPFYALQPIELDNYRSLDGEPVANTSIAEVAGRCIAELRSIQPQGPYLLGGWSLGGIVAFEMAQQLQKQGEKVALLALFDSPTPSSGDRPTDHDDADVMPMFASYLGARRRKKLPLSRDALGKLELNEQFNLVLEQAKMAEVLPPEAGLSQIRALFEVYKNGLRIGTRQLQSYKSQVYTKRIIYFRANDVFEDVLPDATPDWKKLTSESLEIHIVPGDHYTMFLEPYVRVLAQRLDECLDMIQSGRSTSRKISSLIALAGNS